MNAAGGAAGRAALGVARPGPTATGRILVGLGPTAEPPRAARQPAAETGLLVDIALRAVYVDGECVDLSATQFDLLAFLVRNAGQAHGRRDLLRAVWGVDRPGTRGRTVDVLVTRLRHRLGPDYRDGIQTLRGFGYRLHPDPRIDREAEVTAVPVRPGAGLDRWRVSWTEHTRRLPAG
jgi:DNA-binding response OmpR family regulator